jgi:hypothetical protein
MDRLESWKEIAAYLKRDVQRWEKSSGLPVHRLQIVKSGGVYAFKFELDAWCSGFWIAAAAILAGLLIAVFLFPWKPTVATSKQPVVGSLAVLPFQNPSIAQLLAKTNKPSFGRGKRWTPDILESRSSPSSSSSTVCVPIIAFLPSCGK